MCVQETMPTQSVKRFERHVVVSVLGVAQIGQQTSPDFNSLSFYLTGSRQIIKLKRKQKVCHFFAIANRMMADGTGRY
jgi:hypothetical protein